MDGQFQQIRPAPAIEERAKPRRKGTGKNAKHDDGDSEDQEEDEQDRIAREQFAQDHVDDDDHDEDMAREDEQRPLEGMVICSSGQLKLPRVRLRILATCLLSIDCFAINTHPRPLAGQHQGYVRSSRGFIRASLNHRNDIPASRYY
jgi:hypothetical protein